MDSLIGAQVWNMERHLVDAVDAEKAARQMWADTKQDVFVTKAIIRKLKKSHDYRVWEKQIAQALEDLKA